MCPFRKKDVQTPPATQHINMQLHTRMQSPLDERAQQKRVELVYRATLAMQVVMNNYLGNVIAHASSSNMEQHTYVKEVKEFIAKSMGAL